MGCGFARGTNPKLDLRTAFGPRFRVYWIVTPELKFLPKIFKCQNASAGTESLSPETQPLHGNNPHAFALSSVFLPNIPDSHEAAVVWKRFQTCATIPGDCMLGAMAWCSGTPKQIRLGKRTICRGILLCDSGLGLIEIGDLVYIGDDVIISTRERIRIGARTVGSHGVQIFDNDSHPIDAHERHADYLNLIEGRPRTHFIPSAPVEIGEDCWVGANSIVLKGVKIGDRSVVAAGSVVTADIGADCVAAGNPARILRSLI
jgi:acetyltransferase-like isoleucine patch superfamily enzyme